MAVMDRRVALNIRHSQSLGVVMETSLSRLSLFTSPNNEGNSTQRSLKRWSFRLVDCTGSEYLAATDFESGVTMERLGLLAVVRGLEALDRPSHVTLANPSRVVSRGLQYGMDIWRKTGWRWERFGQMALIRNADLWQRIDVAMGYHQLVCRKLRPESAHTSLRGPHYSKRRRRRISLRDNPHLLQEAV